MENTSETVTLSNIHSDTCVDSGCTDQRLKLELDQMISKRKRKNKQEFTDNTKSEKISNKISNKTSGKRSNSGDEAFNSDDLDTSDSDIDESSEVLEKMKHRNTSTSVSRHLSTSSMARDWKDEKKSKNVPHTTRDLDININLNKKNHATHDNRAKSHHVKKERDESEESDRHEPVHKVHHIDHRYDKISKVTKDTRGDVLRILLILQKIIDDTRMQKQKMAKMEIKIKELDEKIENQSVHYFKQSSHTTEPRRSCVSDRSDFHAGSSSSDKDHSVGNSREYELKFDRFKQEVNTELIKINNSLIQSNTNFDEQLSALKSQVAQLFSIPARHPSKKC
jgi:hypothetical protein